MRYCLLALILQSVSFCAADLEEYQKPHIAEEKKSFTCDKRLYHSTTLKKHRDENGNFPAIRYSRASILDYLYNVFHEQQTNEKVMYAEDNNRLSYHFLTIFSDYQPVATHVTDDILVFDDKSRACAIITQVELKTPSPQGSRGRSKKAKPYTKYCRLH
ncbi:putative secreted effector protein [Blumeria graminis f. sp. tritici 96224]|uniref:Putative secreted effector protein n=1 Tax=Blumeria graminis f. sp. tritici 96224 TaxID=1268274 RepID=A0A656KRV1_BLUGR|nr:putative secreted effector protein [Blumeria graminis f. sp. tritici 96224]